MTEDRLKERILSSKVKDENKGHFQTIVDSTGKILLQMDSIDYDNDPRETRLAAKLVHRALLRYAYDFKISKTSWNND